MQMFKRISLFLIVNLLVIATLSIVMSVLGIGSYVTAAGLNYGSLIAFCLIWGFGGAFISLAISRMMAKWMMGVKVVDPSTTDPRGRWLVDRVHSYARQAGLPVAPEVGIYESQDLNAFATGPTRSRALVAVSTGLLDRMNEAEVEGVLAHEVAHIANGDMVTMTLVQGVINAFVLFLSRIAAHAASQAVKEELQPVVRLVSTIVFDIALSFLGMIAVSYFSRQREFRADAGGARLAGREKMAAALRRLMQQHQVVEGEAPRSIAAFQINGRPSKLVKLFSTHPPLEERIKRLEMPF